MTSDAAALRVSIDLLHMPSRVRLARSEPLPPGVVAVLRVAAGDEEAIGMAVEMTGRSRDVVRQSAAFFIEQLMLYPEADSYRVLGGARDSTTSELRRNMALLLTWLHPDLGRHENRTVLAQRVTRAWDDLKTLERRERYDRTRPAPEVPASRKSSGASAQADRSLNRRRSSAPGARDKDAPLAAVSRKPKGPWRGFPRRGWSLWRAALGRGPSGVDR